MWISSAGHGCGMVPGIMMMRGPVWGKVMLEMTVKAGCGSRYPISAVPQAISTANAHHAKNGYRHARLGRRRGRRRRLGQ